MRVSNLNSFSAVIDRMIIESLKLLTFIDKEEADKIEIQKIIVENLKIELDKIYLELYNKEYISTIEQRTYIRNNLFNNLFKLCLNNYCIAKYDKLKIEEASKNIVNVENIKNYINVVRGNLEERADAKNGLENI